MEVKFCNWCPEPKHPSKKFHPDGKAHHREKARMKWLKKVYRWWKKNDSEELDIYITQW